MQRLRWAASTWWVTRSKRSRSGEWKFESSSEAMTSDGLKCCSGKREILSEETSANDINVWVIELVIASHTLTVWWSFLQWCRVCLIASRCKSTSTVYQYFARCKPQAESEVYQQMMSSVIIAWFYLRHLPMTRQTLAPQTEQRAFPESALH